MFEDAFGKIKEATGVSDLEEVLQKIDTQESTRDNLMKLSKENQTKIEELQEDLKKSGARLEELKYAGPSARSGARKIIDDIEQKCTEAMERREKHKTKYERVKRKRYVFTTTNYSYVTSNQTRKNNKQTKRYRCVGCQGTG